VTFEVWRRGRPNTMVLRPVADAREHYAAADWEKEISESAYNPGTRVFTAGLPSRP